MNVSKQIEEILEKYIEKDEKIILACSTWADSMYLLTHLLGTKFKNNIVISYFNHNTRKQCKEEEEYIVHYAKDNNMVVEIGECDFQKIQKLYPGKGFEELAREKRYQFFDALCHIHSARFIMTAHHLDDRIETMLFHMLRGTKLSWLINMTEKSWNIIRPLIQTSKSEIYSYLKMQNIEYFEDKTNEDSSYTRNFIRNEISPKLALVHPEYQKNISHLFEYLESLKSYLDNEVRSFLWKYQSQSFSLSDFLILSSFLQKEIIRYLYFIANNNATIWLSESNIAEILRFMKWKNNKTHKEVHKLHLFKDGNTIIIQK